MMIVCIVVGGYQNNPLYLQCFTEADDALKLHHIVHCSLDVIDERVNNPKKSGPTLNETFLGLLYPTENYKVYSYLTNTKVKFIMVTMDLDVRDVDVRSVKMMLAAGYFRMRYDLPQPIRSNRYLTWNSILSPPRGVTMLAEVMMMWATITKGLHRTHNVHHNLDIDCPTTKTRLFGGTAFLALDAALFWLVCQILTGNARADSLKDEDPKGTYRKVLATDYDASGAGQQGAPRV